MVVLLKRRIPFEPEAAGCGQAPDVGRARYAENPAWVRFHTQAVCQAQHVGPSIAWVKTEDNNSIVASEPTRIGSRGLKRAQERRADSCTARENHGQEYRLTLPNRRKPGRCRSRRVDLDVWDFLVNVEVLVRRLVGRAAQ